MAKIIVTGVSYDQSNYTVIVTLVQPSGEGGDEVPYALGEASVRFPSSMKEEDVKKLIVKTAEEISKVHKHSVDKGDEISQMYFPDIP